MNFRLLLAVLVSISATVTAGPAGDGRTRAFAVQAPDFGPNVFEGNSDRFERSTGGNVASGGSNIRVSTGSNPQFGSNIVFGQNVGSIGGTGFGSNTDGNIVIGTSSGVLTGTGVSGSSGSNIIRVSGGSNVNTVSGGSNIIRVPGGSNVNTVSGGSNIIRVPGGSNVNTVSGGSNIIRVPGGSNVNTVSGGSIVSSGGNVIGPFGSSTSGGNIISGPGSGSNIVISSGGSVSSQSSTNTGPVRVITGQIGNIGTGSSSGSSNGGIVIGNFGSSDSGFLNPGVTGQGSGNVVIIGQGQFPNQGASQIFGQLAPITLTMTVSSTIDRYYTLTETILNSVPVTLTSFNINTVTVTTQGVHQTDVDDVVVITTSVVERPITEFVTTTKSNFIYVTDVAVELFTITHNFYLIHQTTFTTTVTQTLTMNSAVVRTSLLTSIFTSTEYQTIVNTIFVHGYK